MRKVQCIKSRGEIWKRLKKTSAHPKVRLIPPGMSFEMTKGARFAPMENGVREKRKNPDCTNPVSGTLIIRLLVP